MKFYLFLVIIFYTTTFTQWVQKDYGLPSNTWGHCISSIDSLHSVISFGGFVYSTTNGGNLWSRKTNPYDIIDISFTNESNIWFCTTNRIYHSYTGGEFWELQYISDTLSSFLNYLQMFDDSNGIAMGDAKDDSSSACFLRTSDGGNTWHSVHNSLTGGWSSSTWRKVSFVSPSIGYFDDAKSNLVWKTADGCENWTPVFQNDGVLIYLLNFYNENTGIIAATSCSSNIDIIFKTIDGGESWDTVFVQPFNSWVTDLEFLPNDPDRVWLLTLTELFFSSDFGTTWNQDPISYSYAKGADLEFTEEKTGWLICNTIYRNIYADHVTSIENDTFNKEMNFTLYQNYPNPFNADTKINFLMPKTIMVNISVYNILGERMAELKNEEMKAGYYEISFKAGSLPSGVYFYTLKTKEYSITKKMIIDK